MKNTGLCPHRIQEDIDPIFYHRIEELEQRCGFSFYITRSCHCPECNKAVGGAVKSAHMKESHTDLKAKAIDIAIDNNHQKFVIVKNALIMGFTRIEPRDTWVHIDGGLESDGYTQEVMF